MKRILAPLGIFVAVLAGVLFTARFTDPPKKLERPSAQVITDKNGAWMRAYASKDGGMWRVDVVREELPQELVDAVLTFEDQRFYDHSGVDLRALFRATIDNLRAGRVVSGASTLTMQVARMVDPKPRTLRSKLIEIFRALQLEGYYSKDEILVAYLNLAPYGGNIEGVGAAAYFYFGKEVSELTRDEAATLAAIPNAPSRLRPDRATADLLRRRNDVLHRMAAKNLITPADAEASTALPIHARRREAPMFAAHAAERVRRMNFVDRRVVSSIDPELQLRAQALVAAHAREWSSRGAHHAAAVIIENETRKVRALVGSPSFTDRARHGEIDGTDALRSPGSTLKPFVYALALDRGLIGASTLLEDLPLHFTDWSPKNFDDRFRGVISADEALRTSLNIPAVHLAQQLEPRGLTALLAGVGFRGFADRQRELGLSVVLGGCEVTLLELTNLYALLARGGEYRQVLFLENQTPWPAKKIISPEAAYLISEILSAERSGDSASRKMAWKTGTSYGRRDAWTIGYDAKYTIGVWAGNFDGAGVPELVGVEAAAPLFFSIAEVLPQAGWLKTPSGIEAREVCALSGAIAGDHCPHRKLELAIGERAPRTPCALHAAIDVDDATGHRLCPHCRAGKKYHREAHVFWPSAVAAYFSTSKLGVAPVPEHDPRCRHAIAGAGPAIKTPLEGEEFLLRDAVPPEKQAIALLASTGLNQGKIYWFVDGELLGSGPSDQPTLYAPQRGTHEIVAADQDGRRARVKIKVR